VPVCSGITFFKIEAMNGGEYLDKWSGRLPPGVEVTISFAEPFETIDNSWDVYDDQKYKRTIAIDRTRKIKFKITQKPPDASEGKETIKDPNSPEELIPFPEDERRDANSRR
jgi:hypothetical protein